MELKSIAINELQKAQSIGEALKIRAKLSKRQRPTKIGAISAFRFFKTLREDKHRKNKQSFLFNINCLGILNK